jgi:pSer/pThr/pTyr-binding forkhead associated (FHA) protein
VEYPNTGPAPDLGRTTKIPPSATMPAAAPSGGGRTQVFVSLGADIVVDKGPDKGKEFTLHKQVTSIGRPGSRKNDIELNDDTVSKEQSSVYYDGSKKEFSIANESMTNPTKVNGQSISGPIVLDNEAVIEMGRSVLRFRKQ